ncbi:MAG: ATP-binding protein [Longimicrobiales bacterium]|nr:ATP-binding protein [Longimicrobiales bacterium]
MLHSLGEGVSVANAEGRIVFSNAAADRILGIGATDASPEAWSDHFGVFLPEDRTTPFPTDRYPLVRALSGEDTTDVEMWIRNPGLPDGALVAVTGRPLENDDGRIVGATVVFRNITALRKAQDELRRTNERLKEVQRHKDELTAFVVHDLKSPLTSIMLSARLLIDRSDVSGEELEDLQAIDHSAETIHRMVLDLLDIRLAEDGLLRPHVTPVDLGSLLKDVTKTLRGRAGDSGTHLDVADSGDDLTVPADPELLRRVVQNLVDNCLKYAPGGTIRLRGQRPTAASLLVTVEDDGPGVPPDLRDEIFRMWTRTERDDRGRHRDSRGVGLYFARLAVEAHRGRIWVEDSDLGGARFCIELPGRI